MHKITASKGSPQWPRSDSPSVECRDRDLVIRITNWMDDKDEPAFDVEVYIGGVYDWNESESFTIYKHKTEAKAKKLAVEFAQSQINKLL